MALQFGNTKIGGMQYNGVTIGEAMYNGQIVYRSSPYPLTGTFEIVNGAAYAEHEVFSHTVVEPGNFTGAVTRESGQVTGYVLYLNGSNQGTGAVSTFTLTGLSVGDTIRVTAIHTTTVNLSGTWSIVKN